MSRFNWQALPEVIFLGLIYLPIALANSAYYYLQLAQGRRCA